MDGCVGRVLQRWRQSHVHMWIVCPFDHNSDAHGVSVLHSCKSQTQNRGFACNGIELMNRSSVGVCVSLCLTGQRNSLFIDAV